MSKLISFAGVSRVAGVLKFRGAQNVNRITQLQKLGDTDVEMRFLGKEMTKSQAAKELLAMNFANGRADIEALLVATATDDNPFAKPAPKAKKPKTVKITVPSTFGLTVQGKKIKVESADDDTPLSPKQAAKIRAEFMRQLKAVYEAN
jgi:hypothetical protein